MAGDTWFSSVVKRAVQTATAVAPLVSLVDTIAEIATSSDDSESVRLIMQGHPGIFYCRFDPHLETACDLDCYDMKVLTALEQCMNAHIQSDKDQLLAFTKCISML